MKTRLLTVLLAIALPCLAAAGPAQISGLTVITAPGSTVDGDGISVAVCPQLSQVAVSGGYVGGGGMGGPRSSHPYTGAKGRIAGWIVSDDSKGDYTAIVTCAELQSLASVLKK
jgi:hypothetical protein